MSAGMIMIFVTKTMVMVSMSLIMVMVSMSMVMVPLRVTIITMAFMVLRPCSMSIPIFIQTFFLGNQNAIRGLNESSMAIGMIMARMGKGETVGVVVGVGVGVGVEVGVGAGATMRMMMLLMKEDQTYNIHK